MRYVVISIAFGFFLPVSCLGQDFTFVPFGQNEGLKHSQILSISQDMNGNLWLGTATRSIYRFDGKSFYEHKINLTGYTGSLYTFNVYVDNRNRIWILTNIGLVCFNGIRSKLIPTHGDLTLGTNMDLFTDKNSTPWVIDPQGQVFSLVNDSLVHRDDIHKSVSGKIIGHFEKEGTCHLYSDQGNLVGIDSVGRLVDFQLPTPERISFVDYKRGSYLIGSERGVTQYTESQQQNTISVGGGRITKLVFDNDGAIWGISSNRVFVIKDKKLQWVSGSENMTNDALSMFCDRDQNIWISIDVLGIVKYKKQAWKKVKETNGIDVTCVIEKDDGSGVIFGTYNHGIIGLDKPYLVGTPVTSMAFTSANTLLTATLKSGLFEIGQRRIKKIFPGKNEHLSIHALYTENDNVLLGTNLGLYVISPTSTKLYAKKRGRLSLASSSPIIIDNTIFFAVSISGVMKVLGDSIVNVGPPQLENATVFTIRKNRWDEYVVIGEFPQIFFFNSNFELLRTLDLKDFLSNVLLVEFIDQSHIIVGSNDGLFKVSINGDSIENVRKFGKVDGFNGEELYAGSSITTRNSDVVVGTVNGAYIFDPENDLENFSLSSTYLTNVDFQSKYNIDSVQGYFQIPVDPKLQYDENNIEFSFSATNLSQPYNIKFKYMMIGVDQAWSAPSTSQKVTYSNLAPGTYTFCVQAISENSVLGNIVRYNFSIQPAYWQTLPFYVIVSVLVAAIVILIFIWTTNNRIRKIKSLEKVRLAESARLKKQMSMDFHDEMGNHLAVMLTKASLLKMKHSESEFFSTFDFFERHAHAIYQGTKDFIWSIDIASNNLREVISYLRDFGAAYFEENGISFHVSSEILARSFEVLMPEGYNRNIILIFKEAMTNSLKHSKAQNVHFGAYVKDALYTIYFKDDGIGMGAKLTGNGLKNMRNRSAKINSHLSFSQNDGGGTTLLLTLKIRGHESK